MQGSNREAGSGFEAEHSPEEALAELKRIFRAARTAKRLTMAGLETKAGRSHTTVSQALSGPTVPSEATVDALSVALGLDPDAMVKLRNRAAGKGADTEPSPETAERSPVQNFVGLRVRAEMTFHALSEKEVDTALGTPVMVAKAGGRDIVPEEALIHVTVVNETDQTFQVTGLLVEAWEKGALRGIVLRPDSLPAMVPPRSRIEFETQKEPLDFFDAITFIGVLDGLDGRHGLSPDNVRSLASFSWSLPTRCFAAQRRDDRTFKVATYQVRTPGVMPAPKELPEGVEPPEILATRSMFGIPLPPYLRLDELKSGRGRRIRPTLTRKRRGKG